MTITFKVRQHYGEVTAYPADTTDITAGMLLTVNSSGLIEPAGTASTNIIGVAGEDRDVSENQTVPVYQGTIECTIESAGAIVAGATIEPAASGTIDDTVGTASVIDLGVAWEAASGAAEWILVTMNLPKFA